MHSRRIPIPRAAEAVDWQQAVPFSQRYGDRYHSSSGARAQAKHVFLAGCGLPAAWCSSQASSGLPSAPEQPPARALPQDGAITAGTPASQPDTQAVWRILETGFGLGLNFLAAWACWRACASSRRAARLHFISVEAHPVSAADLQRAARQADSELAALGEQLARAWQAACRYPLGQLPAVLEPGAASCQAPAGEPEPLRAPTAARLPGPYAPSGAMPTTGQYRMVFDQGQVWLDVLIGDARQCLEAQFSLAGPLAVDSVFLDGFDPARNPAIWSNATLRAISAHCRPGARMATWSVARRVRDALQAAGFVISKRPGLPPKRACLAGHCQQPYRPGPANSDPATPFS